MFSSRVLRLICALSRRSWRVVPWGTVVQLSENRFWSSVALWRCRWPQTAMLIEFGMQTTTLDTNTSKTASLARFWLHHTTPTCGHLQLSAIYTSPFRSLASFPSLAFPLSPLLSRLPQPLHMWLTEYLPSNDLLLRISVRKSAFLLEKGSVWSKISGTVGHPPPILLRVEKLDEWAYHTV